VCIKVCTELGGAMDATNIATNSLSHQVGDVYPGRIVAHFERSVELKSLIFEIEAKASKRLRIAVEETRRATANDAVERGDTLLSIEEQIDTTRRDRAIAPCIGILGACLPDEEAANGMPLVERGHEAAHLVAVPDIAALELW